MCLDLSDDSMILRENAKRPARVCTALFISCRTLAHSRALLYHVNHVKLNPKKKIKDTELQNPDNRATELKLRQYTHIIAEVQQRRLQIEGGKKE